MTAGRNSGKISASVPEKKPTAKSAKARLDEKSKAKAKAKAKVKAVVPAPTAPVKKHQPPTAPQLTKLPPPKIVFVMPKSIVGEPPPPPKRSKGAPPPVIAKPKLKHKPAAASDRSKEPKRKIDMAHAVSVAQAAVRAATTQKVAGGYVVINGRKVRVMSTKGIKLVRKKAAPKVAATDDDAETMMVPVKLGQTKLPPREIERYHGMLLKLRSELVGRVEVTEKEALKSNDGNLSTMPLHMADIGTDTFEQDFALGFAQHDREIVVEVDEALARVKNGTFGLCLMSGKQIPRGRLDVKPWAKYTIESERIAERSRGRT